MQIAVPWIAGASWERCLSDLPDLPWADDERIFRRFLGRHLKCGCDGRGERCRVAARCQVAPDHTTGERRGDIRRGRCA